MRRIAFVLTLALVASLALGNVAVAAGAETETSFRMNDEGSYVEYKGRVSSKSDRCIKGRKIRVYHNGILIAETRTDEDGRWEVEGPVPPDGDSVTVKVLPKKRDGKVICQGTKRTRTFESDD